MLSQVKGIIVASLTPFHEDGSVDFEALRSHVNFMIEGGVHGFFCAGTYGEGPMLSSEDYRQVSRAFVEAADGRVPIIFQVSAPSALQAVEQARIVTDAGVDVIAAVPAYYYKHDEESLVAYFETLCEATDKPVFIYDNPGRTGNPVTPALFERLIQNDRIVGMKDSSDSIVHFQKCAMVAPRGFKMIIGSDDFLVAGFATGAQGAVVVLGNVFPRLLVDVWEAFHAGEMEKAVELQFKILHLRDVLKKGPYVSMYKEAVRLVGGDAGYARRPLRPLTEKEKTDLASGLRQLGVL